MSKTNTHNYNFLPACPVEPSDCGNFILRNRQHPIHARISTNNERDRRPIDPPPIVQIRLSSATPQQTDVFHQDSYFFMCANLAHPTNDDEIYTPTHNALSGQTFSSMYKLKDIDNNDCAFFIFGDISVKVEGNFRLKLSLFQITITGAICLKSLFTNIFTVYSTRKFPGMLDSTFLSRSFSDQGARIRIRKENRAQIPVSRKRKFSVQDQTEVSSPHATTSPHLLLPLTSYLSPPNYCLPHQEQNEIVSPDTYCDRRSSLASSGTDSTSCSEMNSSTIYLYHNLQKPFTINSDQAVFDPQGLLQHQASENKDLTTLHYEYEMPIKSYSISNKQHKREEIILLPPPSLKSSEQLIANPNIELPPLRSMTTNKKLKTNAMEDEAVAAMIQLSQFPQKDHIAGRGSS